MADVTVREVGYGTAPARVGDVIVTGATADEVREALRLWRMVGRHPRFGEVVALMGALDEKRRGDG